ncbi:NUC 3NT domain [Trypanosoma vivax]|nr:hypothetical protein TRVL_06807 [Trypanosoma vivax]KAH8620608.1 NUC 3NT domain [Trypanosoma vivax]
MTEAAFRGTLLLLQNQTRRDPEAYRDEFLAQLDHFKALTKTVVSQHNTNPQYIAVLNYVCHVGHCFPSECEEVAEILMKLLREFKGISLTSELRLALVKSLALLRSKNIVAAERTFPLFFELLQERDKSLRRVILTHIVSDVRKANMPGAKNGANVNKKAQNFLFGVMADDDPVQARCAEMVMIDLYRRRVWADERTVEVLTRACFSRHTAIIRTALRFFLLQMPKVLSMEENKAENDEEEVDPGRAISKMKQKLKIKKKTGKRERILKREVDTLKRKYNKEEKEEELVAKQHVDPVRLLRDPQQFVERLLARLQRTTERFEVRLLYLNVIARTVSEHEVVHLPLYGFIERYMEPSQLHATQLLALSVMCVHRMVPPDAVEPLVKAIANHFVSDRSSPDSITVGLNTIREICKRQPLAMNADLLKDLVEYKSQRGDRGVVMAARALIQFFRHAYPELLPAKLRSGVYAEGEVPRPVFAQEHVYTDIPGLQLLYADDGDGRESHSQCCGPSDDDSSGDGTWLTDSSECDPDDIEGSFVDVTDSSSDECPQLAPADPVLGAPSLKHVKYENNEQSETAIAGTSENEGLGTRVPHAQGPESLSVEGDSDESGSEVGSGALETDDEEDEEEEEEEEEEEGLAEWFEDAEVNSALPSHRSVDSKVSSSALRILTDEDFARIRLLQQQHGSHRSLRGKMKIKDARARRKEALIHGISADLTADDIEHFTERERVAEREEKIARTQELRRSKSSFEARKKKKSKLNSTHTEHSKRGKLYNMTKRSRRVGAKLKASVADRSQRNKENKKKSIKFRIRRGWKA